MSKPIIALLYDFDKTLCTTDMEDYAFIPALGYTPKEFWHKANTFGRENRMDGLLAYMYTMIAECRAQGIPLTRDFLVRCGQPMELFPGVREWFSRINDFGASLGVEIEHYVLSSGQKEIIEGSGIAHEFTQIAACAVYARGGCHRAEHHPQNGHHRRPDRGERPAAPPHRPRGGPRPGGLV